MHNLCSPSHLSLQGSYLSFLLFLFSRTRRDLRRIGVPRRPICTKPSSNSKPTGRSSWTHSPRWKGITDNTTQMAIACSLCRSLWVPPASPSLECPHMTTTGLAHTSPVRRSSERSCKITCSSFTKLKKLPAPYSVFTLRISPGEILAHATLRHSMNHVQACIRLTCRRQQYIV